MEESPDILALTVQDAHITLETALRRNRASASVRSLSQALAYADAILQGDGTGDRELALAWVRTAHKKVLESNPARLDLSGKEPNTAGSSRFLPA